MLEVRVSALPVQQRDIFAKSVSRYRGGSRVLYCRAAGLTPEFIRGAPLDRLLVVAANLGINVPPRVVVASLPDVAASLRKAIIMFIHIG